MKMKTTRRVLGCLSIAALAILLAAPVSAQTVILRASVPFDFIVGGRTMPAGDYLLSTGGTVRVLEIQSQVKGIAPVLTTINNGEGPLAGDGASLTFNRYGSDYFLASMWDRAAAGGCSIPMSRAEREKARTASLAKPDVVVVLARR
jgi:hypothetical protein